MTEPMWLSLIGGVMVLVLVIGGLARRRVTAGESIKLGLLWIAIIAAATLGVILVRQLLNRWN